MPITTRKKLQQTTYNWVILHQTICFPQHVIRLFTYQTPKSYLSLANTLVVNQSPWITSWWVSLICLRLSLDRTSFWLWQNSHWHLSSCPSVQTTSLCTTKQSTRRCGECSGLVSASRRPYHNSFRLKQQLEDSQTSNQCVRDLLSAHSVRWQWKIKLSLSAWTTLCKNLLRSAKN